MDTVVWLLSLVLLVHGRPYDIDEEVAENFLSSGQRTADELIRVREKLHQLSVKTSRSLRGHFKREFLLYNHDETPLSIPASFVNGHPDEATINKNLPISDYLYQGDIALTEEQLDERLNSRSKRAAIHDGDWPHTKWDPKHGKGCWSYIGRQKRWKIQDLSLGESCENNFGTLTHELMHALGFYHEHSRKDRDKSISINMNNIHPNNTHQFSKETGQDTQGFPYEYGSVMRYANNYNAVDQNIPVFVSKDPNYATTMGQRMKPSFQDIQQVNELYRCWEACEDSGTECGNGGIANVNNYSECLCPYGFGGKYCFDLEKPTKRNSGCGEVVQAPEGRKVAARFKLIDTVECSKGCAFRHVEVKTGNFKQTGYRLCCPNQMGVVFNSTGKTMAVGINLLLYTTSFELEYIAC